MILWDRGIALVNLTKLEKRAGAVIDSKSK